MSQPRIKKRNEFILMGSTQARIRKMAETIRDQEQLDRILARVRPEMREGGLAMIRPYLKFTPRESPPEEKDP